LERSLELVEYRIRASEAALASNTLGDRVEIEFCPGGELVGRMRV